MWRPPHTDVALMRNHMGREVTGARDMCVGRVGELVIVDNTEQALGKLPSRLSCDAVMPMPTPCRACPAPVPRRAW
eukprot:365339-Chlamydomonas_euryale.AAC.12